MKRPFNWRPWGGLLLAFVAIVSYFAFFSRFPVTRDVPWVPFLLFVVAAVLLISGWRRATGKILPSIVAVLGFLLMGFFTYLVTIGSKDMPAAAGAPAVGQKAPEFTLPDTNNRPVSLASTLAGSKGVVLVFYRGFW
jgi:AhpC/TSA family